MDTLSSPPAPRATAGESPATILVIDDERGPRESLRILLKTEFTVLCAESVDAGVALLQAHHPEVVIMDIRMPGKTGIEGLRLIRSLDPIVSVIMFTGFGELETAQEAIRLGANDYIKKPFDAFAIREVAQRHARRTRHERRRQHAAQEVQELNRVLRQEMAQKNQLASLGQKSAELMHDLRNPLTAVMGYVELLSEELREAQDKLGARWQETSDYLDHIEKGVVRCHDIAQMWLDAGRGRRHRDRVALGSLLHTLARECQVVTDKQHITLQLEVREEQGVIEGDEAQLSRALQNLLGNAIEAVTPGQGQIKLWCQETPEQVTVGIADNGCGMPPEQVRQAFEPFFTTKKNSGGTGLGLFVTHQVVEAHGGRIHVESEVGRGTTFQVCLPKTAGGVPA